MDDINSAYTPQYNIFDLGVRYTRAVWGRATTWRVTVNNVDRCSLLVDAGPRQHHRPEHGRYLGHLGEPRLVTASMRFDF